MSALRTIIAATVLSAAAVVGAGGANATVVNKGPIPLCRVRVEVIYNARYYENDYYVTDSHCQRRLVKRVPIVN